MNKKRILYIAYGCEPYSGSEQGVGWNWAVGLSKIANITILTRANNEKVISRWLRSNESTMEFIYYDLIFRLLLQSQFWTQLIIAKIFAI